MYQVYSRNKQKCAVHLFIYSCTCLLVFTILLFQWCYVHYIYLLWTLSEDTDDPDMVVFSTIHVHTYLDWRVKPNTKVSFI